MGKVCVMSGRVVRIIRIKISDLDPRRLPRQLLRRFHIVGIEFSRADVEIGIQGRRFLFDDLGVIFVALVKNYAQPNAAHDNAQNQDDLNFALHGRLG